MADWIWFLLIGGIAGWLAGQFIKGSGYGIIGNVFLGIAGGIVGGFLFRLIGLKAVGTLGSVLMSAVGAVLLMWIVSKLKK